MIKKFLAASLLLTLMIPTTASAEIDWGDIFNMIAGMYGVSLDTNKIDKDQLDKLKDINNSLTGTHNYGNKNYDKNTYVWGNGTDDWQQVLAMSRNGGSGELGSTISELSKQFPMTGSLKSRNPVENDYYDLQARTALASRSSAEVAYKQAVKEEKTMRNLHDMIDHAEDQKSAADLNNRFAAENAMTNVQQTKLLSILVQQQAVSAQEKANRAKEDMEFFDNK